MQNNNYDYIIAGSGCAGLSLLIRMLATGRYAAHRFLLIDRDSKTQNDRTWCFWEKEPGLFESIVYHSWDNLKFFGPQREREIAISPYRYKMIRGIDFYRFCFEQIAKYSNVTVVQATVLAVGGNNAVETTAGSFSGGLIFNSIVFEKPVLGAGEFYLLQHFKGWRIKTTSPAFDPTRATLMDFRVSQSRGTTFVYVMPFTETEALVEYTLFSPALLDDGDYEKGLKQYLTEHLGINNYEVIEEEFGVIPMTNYRFSRGSGRIINIGTAGGATKGSSGYTFQFIQKTVGSLLTQMENGQPPKIVNHSGRFDFYDSVLLRILAKNRLGGAAIFQDIFFKNDPSRIFRFLDNESSISDDLPILLSLPMAPFIRAAIEQFWVRR